MNSIIHPLWAGKKVCKPPRLPGTTLLLGLEMQKGQQLCVPEMQRQNCMSRQRKFYVASNKYLSCPIHLKRMSII